MTVPVIAPESDDRDGRATYLGSARSYLKLITIGGQVGRGVIEVGYDKIGADGRN